MLGTLRTILTIPYLLVLCRRGIRPFHDVTTPQGTVRGYLAATHATYLGIPYAQMDRYKAPEPPPSWDGIFEATHRIKCPQPGEAGDENCLVANVFTPRGAPLLPVYVIVHDGDFRSGWGTHELPHSLNKDFVVVSFNYRIGALGFLCLGTPVALGNAGLKDQVAALYWVHRNIKHFGGNPDNVIVHGVGSAAISIQILLLSGLVEGLVHKVILESGSVLSPLSMTYDPVKMAYQGAASLRYNGSYDAEDIYKFYIRTPLDDLINIQEKFLPCAEEKSNPHSLLDFDPILRLKSGKYQKVPTLITYTDELDTGNETQIVKVLENMSEFLPNNLEFGDYKMKEKVGEIVKEFYFGAHIFSTDNVEQNYFDYIYDIFVEYPIVNFAMLYAGKGSHIVHLMKFPMEGDSSADETRYETILKNLQTYKLKNDDVYSEKLFTLWRNFIQIGDPTPLTTSLIPVSWQPVVTDRMNKRAILTVPMILFGTNLKMSTQSQNLLFWDNIYNKFYKTHIKEVGKSDDLDDND